MTKNEIFEIILRDAVKQFNAATTQAKKRAIIKNEATEIFNWYECKMTFLQYATIEIHDFLFYIKETPYAGLNQRTKNAACLLSLSMNFEVLAGFAKLKRNNITEILYYALQKDKSLQSLEKVYDKEIKKCREAQSK